MYDPQSLEALFDRLQAHLRMAMAQKEFGTINRFAQALAQLESWRTTETVTDLPPEVVTALLYSLGQETAAVLNKAGCNGALSEPIDSASPAVAQQQAILGEGQPLSAHLAGVQLAPPPRRLPVWWSLLLGGVILLALIGVGWNGWQDLRMNQQVRSLAEINTQIDHVGQLVSGALGAMSTPVAGLPTQIAALSSQLDALGASGDLTAQQSLTAATQLDALVAPLAALPGQVDQLSASVDGVQTAVAALEPQPMANAPTAVLAPTPNAEATWAAWRAPMESTATAQAAQAARLVATAAALATHAAEPTLVTGLSAPAMTLTVAAFNGTVTATEQTLATREAVVAARETALAVTSTPMVATTIAPVTAPLTDARQATTASLLPPNPPLSITFPISGAELYIAPWVVTVSARSGLTETGAYRLLLNDAVLVPSFSPVAGQTTEIYRRTITADFDDFPGLSPEDHVSLGLDARNQLPPGRYTLRIESVTDGSPLYQVEFIIRDNRSLIARNNTVNTLLRRPEPTDQSTANRVDQRSLRSGAQALVLGKAVGPYQNQPRLWCYWEAVENPRRGWTLCQFLTLVDSNQPADQVTDTIPDLLPLP